MLDIFLNFLGIDIDITWSDELISCLLPVLITIAAGLTLYMFICFFQFIIKILHK